MVIVLRIIFATLILEYMALRSLLLKRVPPHVQIILRKLKAMPDPANTKPPATALVSDPARRTLLANSRVMDDTTVRITWLHHDTQVRRRSVIADDSMRESFLIEEADSCVSWSSACCKDTQYPSLPTPLIGAKCLLGTIPIIDRDITALGTFKVGVIKA
jgi:hypothetical protein